MLDILTIIAPVFLCAVLGWAWARSGRSYDRNLITLLISDIGAPCLVFSRLIKLDVDPSLMVDVAGAAMLAMLCFGVIAGLALRSAGLPWHTFLGPMVFMNSGNMGLPLCLFAFGDQGLALAVCYFATVSVTHFTLGVWIWSGSISVRELLRTPLSWAVLLAVLVVAADLDLPVWLRNTTELLGGFTIPLMLLTLGVSLGELRLAGVPRTLALSALRLGMGFSVGVGLAELLDLRGLARGVFIVESAMPAAVFNYLMAERYRRSPEAVASLVVLSTLLAFAGLPALLAFVL